MGKCIEWLENKGHHLMTIFIIIQTLIFITFIFLYSLELGTIEEFWKSAYTWAVLALFLSFMIYFAYHSIRKGYFIELIAFLLMSTISSTLLVYYFFKYVINNETETYKVIGIICVVLLILGNLIYFFSAYFAYNHFELIFMEKFGAKEKHHKIFAWLQFQHSMLKCDLGLIIYLLIALFVFNNSNWVLLALDIIYLAFSIGFVMAMKKYIRDENQKMTYYLLGIRILTEGYYIFRVYKLLNHAKNLDNFNYDNLIIISVMFNVFILVTIIFSTYKCVQNYGEGFKEMLNKQRNQGINSTDFNMSITPNFNQF